MDECDAAESELHNWCGYQSFRKRIFPVGLGFCCCFMLLICLRSNMPTFSRIHPGIEQFTEGNFTQEFNCSSFKPNFLFLTIKSTARNHKSRLTILLETWIPVALSLRTRQLEPVIPLVGIVTDRPYENGNHPSRVHIRNTSFCGSLHNAFDLTCKLQEELRLYFTLQNHAAAWFCHFDDDTYVNVLNLIRKLGDLGDPLRTPYYVGKSPRHLLYGYNTTDHLFENADGRINTIHFASGQAFCLSHRLMHLLEGIIRNDSHALNMVTFAKRLSTQTGDDVILSHYVSGLLGVPLTYVKEMYSTLDALNELDQVDLDNAITLSHHPKNTFKVPMQNFTGLMFNFKFRTFHKDSARDAQTLPAGASSFAAFSQRSTGNKVNLTVCAMVRNEVPYIVEWIDHHLKQGVDRFVMYDDGSTDDTNVTPYLYPSGTVSVLPANLYRNNRIFEELGPRYLEKQLFVLDHCNRRSSGRSRYIAAIDVDEFLVSNSSVTIWRYIAARTHRPQFLIKSVRYGTSGIQRDFSGELTPDPFKGSVTVAVASNETTEGAWPLIQRANPNRAPHPDLDADFEARHYEICEKNRTMNQTLGCIHADGKSIWKPGRCKVAGVHGCKTGLTSAQTYKVALKNLRLNHFAFRSREHVEHLNSLMKPIKKAAFDLFDTIWFSSRFDPMWHEQTGQERRDS
ncbi:putative Beta-1,3-N-acetylglucosaminyltransferase lunatic fringe [Hypsibius exemplaris]|uniref:Beta-1,3-N-acetylglucosaminyltransferase lunatic fringe n=1 Tax=Hypsibius exemplaris TaxID=2072580 RepID=A0A9X6RLK3_HYPEX|nr:putative Beta-1,3-N-acetylglucosaminyltransferase lunatic fringe [Hypsibius exemplaris]